VKRNAVNALRNDQILISGLVFLIFVVGVILIQSFLIALINNENIGKVLLFFVLREKEITLILFVLLLCLLRAMYIIFAFSTSVDGIGKISKVLSNKSWKEIKMADINRDVETAIIVNKENNRNLNRFVTRASNIAAIEFIYQYEGKNYRRKQYFWKMNPKKILIIASNNNVNIRINKYMKSIAFLII